MKMNVNEFFVEFLKHTERSDDTKMAGTLCFGMDAEAADRAAQKILSGEKRAMIYPERGYRAALHAHPAIGDLNVVVDWNGNPVCVIETTQVRACAAGEITEEQIAMTAENISAAAWLEDVIRREIEELGGSMDSHTPLIIEEFRRA